MRGGRLSLRLHAREPDSLDPIEEAALRRVLDGLGVRIVLASQLVEDPMACRTVST